MNPIVSPQVEIEDDRTGLSIPTLRRAIADQLFYIQGKYPGIAGKNDYYMAVAYTVRDRILQKWLATTQAYFKPETRIVCYLSAEFLLGPHLANNLTDISRWRRRFATRVLVNLGIYDQVRNAVEDSGLDLDELIEQEEEPGLGNGGLGRLAACYMESLSSLEIAAIGYGIRYEYGIFDQTFRDGWQVEITDKWLRFGNPWEIPHPEEAVEVKLGGYTEPYTDAQGNYRVRWVPAKVVKAIPYDTPTLGYRVNTCNTLRLWKAEAIESFDFQSFNVGDYYGSVREKVISENITKVLYPNDEQIEGKELRLEQQFFFVSSSLQDMIRLHLNSGRSLDTFQEKFTVQLNDTHPAIAVAERTSHGGEDASPPVSSLMRLLIDEYHLDWDKAWDITTKTCAYTNHTLLPEALEKWSVSIFGRLLPRHLEIIYELNRRFLDQVRIKYPNDDTKLSTLSLIDDSGDKYVRMANLASLGSFAINGVAALHTELLKTSVLKDVYELWPEKFSNKTNGVTPRRWLVVCNPRLTNLINLKIGDHWVKYLSELHALEQFAEDVEFRKAWAQVKQDNKVDLAKRIKAKTGIIVNPKSLFDVQIKRIHEYKRQHLNALHIITLYNQIKHNPNLDITPRTFIFGGKAAPGYYMAKLIIKLINSIAEVVNNDPVVGDRLKVVFMPDYNVTNSQAIFPAADISEQISTAGYEASGTGNMKLSLNGALTIGTLDGANVEIREEVGAENFFLFGLTVEQVKELRSQGYNPWDYYNQNPQLKEVIDLISSGVFSRGDSSVFRPLVENLLWKDPYLLLADYQYYVDCQAKVSQAYRDRDQWTKMSILNVARMGKFSSDRSIRDYCNDIWHVQPHKIDIPEYIQANAGLRVEKNG